VRNISVNPATFKESVVGYRDETKYNLRANVFADYTLPFGLNIHGTYSYGDGLLNLDSYTYAFDGYKYNAATDTYATQGGVALPSRQSQRQYAIDKVANIQLTYNKKFGDHALSALVVYEYSDTYTQSTTLNSVPDNNYNEVITLAQTTGVSYAITPGRDARYTSRINYNYKSKYLLELLGSYNGSWVFPPGHRWGFFPNVSVGWVASEEKFFKEHLGFIDNFKVRASYGVIGQITGIANWAYLGGGSVQSNVAQASVFGGTLYTGIDPRDPPTTNITWVDSKASNIGFDFSILKNKLSGQFCFRTAFLHAWFYFEIVKRMGGVPIITSQLIMILTAMQPTCNMRATKNQKFAIL
jgi:hypothetical protein